MKSAEKNDPTPEVLMAEIIIPPDLHNGDESFSEELKDKPLPVCRSVAQMKINLRTMLEGHVTWYQSLMLCVGNELPGRTLAEKHLVQEFKAIGNAAKLFYGKANGEKLNVFFSGFTNVSLLIITAAKENNLKILDESVVNSSENAEEFSEFLFGLNSNWDLQEMKVVLKNYFRLVTNESLHGINKKRGTDLVGFEKMKEEITRVADFICNGVFKQFPEKFEPDLLK